MTSKEREVMEPVAWMDIDEKGFGYGLRYWSEPDNRHEVPLYTTPPQRTAAVGEDSKTWVGLTDEHPLMVFAKECVLGAYKETELADAAQRAIKAAHGITGDTHE